MLAFASGIIFSSCKKETVVNSTNGEMTITFDAKVGDQDFALNKNFTIDSRTYNFNHFRYWVSNVVLVKADGSEYAVPNSYYLMEETEAQAVQDGQFQYPARKREDVLLSNIPVGDYKAIKFSIGVDNKYNDNLSLQAGELSQLNGMTNVSWMWHTTYIFSALGGKVTENAVTKDIKVETGINKNYKTVTVQLPQMLTTTVDKSAAIVLKADVAKVLDGIDLITTPVVGAGQITVMESVAGNYETKVYSAASIK